MAWQAQPIAQQVAMSQCVQSQQEVPSHVAFLLLSHLFRTPVHAMVPLIFRVGLPSSAKLVEVSLKTHPEVWFLSIRSSKVDNEEMKHCKTLLPLLFYFSYFYKLHKKFQMTFYHLGREIFYLSFLFYWVPTAIYLMEYGSDFIYNSIIFNFVLIT